MKLRELFEKYEDYSFKFIRIDPAGNYGDYLIYIGAEKLANEVGIRYETVSHKSKIDRNDIIYIHGCGGYNTYWGLAPNILKVMRKRNTKNLIIVGPSTVSLELNYLKWILPKDTKSLIFFARERTSYEYMKRNFCINTYLDEDTSLCLSHRDPFFKAFIGDASIEEKYKFLALRGDKERCDSIPKEIDVGEYDVVCDPCKTSSIKEWVNLHLKASKITTNRAHSAIFGAILGKKVETFANSYHKNRSLWEYSLKDRGVSWIGPTVSNGTYPQWYRTVARNVLYRCFLSFFPFPSSLPRPLIKIFGGERVF